MSQPLYNLYSVHKWNLIPKTSGKTNKFNEKESYLLESVWVTYGNKSGNEL